MDKLSKWIKEIEAFIAQDQEINTSCYVDFVESPELALPIIDCLTAVNEENEEVPAYYSACIFVLEVCVSQLQSATDNGNKNAEKVLNKLMTYLADEICKEGHSLSFWMPILNAFYDANTSLSDELKEAYYILANNNTDVQEIDERSHLDAMRDFIADYSDLSIYDIAENFFAQSSAMPPDFFVDLILDLYSIDEGHEIALLTLLHPKAEVREIVVVTFESLIPKITLSSESLTRLQMIRNLYPQAYHPQIDNWIKIQRKKGVIFSRSTEHAEIVKVQASEVDGGGAQGVFMQIKKKRKSRICGLLLKQKIGIKDAWFTPVMSLQDIAAFNREAIDETLTLRTVDEEYLKLIVNHCLAVTIENGNMPALHFLEIQEELGINFLPEKIDIDSIMQTLSVEIAPFTMEVVDNSLQRSKKWLKTRRFADSWFMESSLIDKLVNRCSSIEDGIKVCNLDDAIVLVFQESLENLRDEWMFHFLWTALWARVKVRKNEKLWEDCFIIAYSIYNDEDLRNIPILREICSKSVLNSMQTMQERGTHLSV